MDFLYVKAIHIIFVVTWFSGLFYIVRLFVYNAEANDMQEPDKSILQKQFALMSKRLWYGITWPSAIITLIMGTWLIYLYPSIPNWLYIKIGIVAILYAYHFSLHHIIKQQSKGIFTYSGNQLRMWNEVPTVLLVAIIMLVVVKQSISLLYGTFGLVALIILLLSAIKIYKLAREIKR